MNINVAECGTYSGYQRHLMRRENTCDECRRANAAYHKDYRARRPDIYAKTQAANYARSRALWRLAKRYPKEFRALYLEEIGA